MPKYESGAYLGEVLTEEKQNEIWMDGYETGVRNGISNELSQMLRTLNSSRRDGATAIEICMLVFDRWQDFLSEH